MRDDDVRAACFAALDVLGAQFGVDVPYSALKEGFNFRGRRPQRIGDEIERRYVIRQVRQRVHQAQFRGAVVPAYLDQCAVCRLKEVRLLDAAHIDADVDEEGVPVISNGLSLCTIHHRAYDQDLIGISPDRVVHVARRLLDDEDGPMLDLLKSFHRAALNVPSHRGNQPDRTRLARRFERFASSD